MTRQITIILFAIACLAQTATAGAFDLAISPEARDVAPGTGVEFVLDVAFCDGYAGTVVLSAIADPDLEIVIQDSVLSASGPAVMSVVTDTFQVSQTYSITVSATDGHTLQTVPATLNVNDHPLPYDMDVAKQIRETAIQYLADHHPEFVAEFGLSPEREWVGYVPYPPLLVVTNYVFLSNQWRMVVLQHNTIPPYDWERVFLSSDRDGAYWAMEINTDEEIREIPCRKHFYHSMDASGIDQGPDVESNPRLWLSGNQPNPFDPRTTMIYTLEQPTRVRLTVHDVQGRLVTILVDGMREAGEHRVSWQGMDGTGRALPGGIYFATLTTSEGADTRKLVIAR